MDNLVPRHEVFDTYWYFAYERLQMMYRRINDDPVLTVDPILSHFKFCNTFRVCDRVSQYLVENVQYDRDWSGEDLVLRTLLFRLFSWPPTWEAIDGPTLSCKTIDTTQLSGILDDRFEAGNKLYTSAFILSGSNAFGKTRKHQNHIKLIEKMLFTDHITDSLLACESLKDVYDLLISYPMIGRFMAYQLAIDLNYSTVIDFEESSFTVAGPGAERGIRKCFISLGDNSLEDIIMYMVRTQDEHFDRLGFDFKGLYGRKLQAIDCQGLFCETDKYSRVKFPQLASNRVRIKTKYVPTGKLEELFFPPKWKLTV
jgi:hypothetical protein